MGCTSPIKSKYYRPRNGIEPSMDVPATFSSEELKLLKLMFHDVAVRSPDERMTKENFFTFFHINGLWGHSIFKRFDKNNSGTLDFEEFREGIVELVKGSPKKRVYALFDFYDIDREGSICFNYLLEMLYSYPKEYLREILQDRKFLATMTKQDREYLMKESNLNKVLLQIEEESLTEEYLGQLELKRTQSETITTEAPQIVVSPNPIPTVEVSGAVQPGFQNAHSKWDKFVQQPSVPNPERLGLPQTRRRPPGLKAYRSSIEANESVLLRSKIRIAANITLLVKRYASFLFAYNGLDIHKDSFTYEHFSRLVQTHENIFDSYFSGFHNYIWEIPERYDLPQFLTSPPDIEGECLYICLKENHEHHRHLRLFKTTLFVMKNHDGKMPHEIKNMEGLLVDEYHLVKRNLYGFIVRHRDGVYPEKAYMFKHQEEQEYWLKWLDDYRKVPLVARYIIEKKLGAGNFSVVYKAVHKETNDHVAIKEIAKFKLSKESRDIIQHECAILERCHHPNIIRFVEMSETKTHIYIVTELMAEGDLYEYVRRQCFLDEYEASIVMKQIIQAVLYLDALGLIHRDLKPYNILVHKRQEKDLIERVKIIDFGFAIYKTVLEDIPASEKFLGSLNYVAPEVIQQQDYDQTIDNFSIGVIMYFMLSGVLPFEALVPEETKRLTVECRPPMDSSHWKNISSEAKDLISKLVAPRNSRICLNEALKHPWIVDIYTLRSRSGLNKRYQTRYTF